MRRSTEWISLIASGLLLFNLLAAPVQAATPEALEEYTEAVENAAKTEGKIDAEERATLDQKKKDLGLTDEEATQIEEKVQQAM
jgi:uncharacterized membrane protein YebE (DUF533 family)